MSQEFSEKSFKDRLAARHRRGKIGEAFFLVSNIFGLLMLVILVGHILNNTFGMAVVRNTIEPSTLAERPLEALSSQELVDILLANKQNLRVIIRDTLSTVPPEQFTTAPLKTVLANTPLAAGLEDLTINDLTEEQLSQIVVDNVAAGRLYDVVVERVVKPNVVRSWQLIPSIFQQDAIRAEAAEKYPNDTLMFRSWLNWDFITSSASSSATTAGLQTALLGTFWIIFITTIVALVLGVGAAIYLEEYSQGSAIEQFIEINIRNLAAIPSIIYGMLGLAVFVRALGEIFSGRFVGLTDTNGRTVLAAGFTLALLILPNLIVTSQEALRAVPRSIREASYGLGATKWQTVSRQVLPSAASGILTGIILSISRAVGETAPLLVVGASTFLTVTPNGPFSKFTVVPIQIFQWTARPEAEFRNVAAAAILVLLTVMITLNLTAIILRNRLSRRV